jgi:hypothetical protein
MLRQPRPLNIPYDQTDKSPLSNPIYLADTLTVKVCPGRRSGNYCYRSWVMPQDHVNKHNISSRLLIFASHVYYNTSNRLRIRKWPSYLMHQSTG